MHTGIKRKLLSSPSSLVYGTAVWDSRIPAVALWSLIMHFSWHIGCCCTWNDKVLLRTERVTQCNKVSLFYRGCGAHPDPSFRVSFLAAREWCPLLLSLQPSWDRHHPQLLHATPDYFAQKSYSPDNMKNSFIWRGKKKKQQTLIWLFNNIAGFLGWHWQQQWHSIISERNNFA